MLEASDVQLQSRQLVRTYSATNFIFYVGQMTTLAFFSSSLLDNNSILTLNRQSPVYVSATFYLSGWIACFSL
jgi:plastocyanin domain-containing protein